MAGLHHRINHGPRAKRLNDAANRDPSTRCWVCGLTLAEVRRIKPRATWTAGHVVDGQVGGELRPEHSCCNYSRGARRGNAMRRAGLALGSPPPTVRW